uniref:hypothetical protein n=1 Tax=Saccharomonospora saliphila TaxID=369829 RepID=UPI00037F88A9
MADSPKPALSLPAVVGLAALGVPRVVAHDLDLVGPVGNAVLVFVPVSLWLVVVVGCRVVRPFRTLLSVGAAYGVLLAVTHQVLWIAAHGGRPPRLGGNLAGVLSPMWEQVVLRVLASASGLLTGVAVGAAVGVVAWALVRVVPGLAPRAPHEHT